MKQVITFLGGWRRKGAVTAVLLLAAIPFFTLPGLSSGAAPVLARASDALKRFVDRSPGERGETDMIKGESLSSKLARVAGAGKSAPTERALGKIFDTPPEEAIGPMVANPVDPSGLTGSPVDGLTPLSDFANAANPAPRTFSGIPGLGNGASPLLGALPAAADDGSTDDGGTTVPGDGGDTPGGNVDIPTIPGGGPDTPVGAVPEPDTWALMVIGFGFCGAALRRRKKASRLNAPHTIVCVRD